MYCHKHSDVETTVSCGRCEKPICPACTSYSKEGVRCEECAAPRRVSTDGLVKVGGSLVGGGFSLLVVVVTVGSLINLIWPEDYYDEYDDEYYEDYVPYFGTVTIDEVSDPWLDSDMNTASEGNRFYAIHVTIENDNQPDDLVPVVVVYDSWYKLTDSDRFVYVPIENGASPSLPNGASLEPGQRASGWVTFEVPEASVIDSLTFWEESLALPTTSAALNTR